MGPMGPLSYFLCSVTTFFISEEGLQDRGRAPVIISQDIPEVTHFQDTAKILQTGAKQLLSFYLKEVPAKHLIFQQLL